MRKLFKAKAHRPKPVSAAKNVEIGMDTFISMESISWEIPKGPIIREISKSSTAQNRHQNNTKLMQTIFALFFKIVTYYKELL